MYILDCTLRDGGYYNNWDFSPEVVTAYLKAMAVAKIDYVELGLRNFPKQGFDGPFAYTTEAFIKGLNLPSGPTYGVMVDAKTILDAPMSIEQAVDALFVDAIQSPVDLVRVAAHFHEVENSEAIVHALKAKGYIVGYNLMQAGGKPDAIIAEKAAIAAKWNGLDSLYFADSLGNMDAEEVTRIVKALRTQWQGDIGIHTHNNMGKALDNTITAKNLGVTWLDVTVTGMGRGAGNAQTESLLAVIDSNTTPYQPSAVYELVIRHFEQMQKDYGWGSSLLYFLGAQNDVHPTYIQNLISNKHYGTEEIVGAINYLSQLEGTTSYNGDVMESAISFDTSTKAISGTDKLLGKFKDKEVLIISNGPSLKRYLPAIEAYIQDRQPIVIAINAVSTLASKFVNYYCVSHNSKFLSEHDVYKNLQQPLIMPAHRFTDDELSNVSNKFFDYGLNIEADEFIVTDNYCAVPYDLTAAYALAIAVHAQATHISLVGVDGYERGDIRQAEMIDLLAKFKGFAPTLQITALTPTSYPIQQGSIYAPNL
ncbi:pyruvate carboxyltransferase [Shewanella sp. Choline-02u-19]|uniref:aldolase catalytic domain-containing protein n=1 Tax=unclassified Shewanella TaxID=196818 RepID=UPI000C32634D|nr:MULTISPECIES: aldolase catalytic domain-containing protein [unclassified Shewanella]PKG57651.1 pyruvate carboxyltransferase [Shewanella sp. GutDb-MelDb]PKG72928.1 pyruvate carboxyltransferase [Shewanella sp. GutCb]PKH58250.1 pyruvate carboxyltransferase [Shewanella sp. Bg11-22]PKI29487.1 pyruvate carboxyltransferase [Shewanella sp. Choline-02u-19]